MNGQRPLLVSNDPELIRGDPPSDRRRGGPEPLAAGPLGPRRSRLQPSRRLFPAYAPTRRHPHLTGAFGRYLAERGAGCRARCGPAPGRALAHRSPGRDQRGPARNGRLLAVVGAGASAGASTFAVTLALAAARSGKALLVVPTHWGRTRHRARDRGRTGIRWLDLADTRGRLGAQSLEQALPRIDGLAVLSGGAADLRVLRSKPRQPSSTQPSEPLPLRSPIVIRAPPPAGSRMSRPWSRAPWTDSTWSSR
jgi:hypothetical protein